MRSDPPRSVPSASAIIPVTSAAAPPPVEPPALFVQRTPVQRNDRVDRTVVALEPREARLDYLDRRDLAAGDEPGQLGGGEVWKVRHFVHPHSPTNPTTRANAASPPLNFHGKQPRMSRLFWSSGASMSPPRFSMWMHSRGNSALWVSWYAESGNIRSTPSFPPNIFSAFARTRSEEHTSELQSRRDLVCRLLLEKKKKIKYNITKN